MTEIRTVEFGNLRIDFSVDDQGLYNTEEIYINDTKITTQVSGIVFMIKPDETLEFTITMFTGKTMTEKVVEKL